MLWNIGFNDGNYSSYDRKLGMRFGFYGLPYSMPPILQFKPTPLLFNFYYPSFPTQNGGGGGYSAGITDKQKAQIEEISKMKYDSENLRAKLDENKDINSYAKFFENNSDYVVKNTINTSDGGKILIYEDKNGNKVGSINKDSNGKIRNVALDIADGGIISLNDNDNNGTIDSRYAMSKNNNLEGNNKTLESELKQFLDKYPGYSTITQQLDDGSILEDYTFNGKHIANIKKNPDGTIILLHQFNIKDHNNKEQNVFYNDINENGIIDAGDATTRFDINLS